MTVHVDRHRCQGAGVCVLYAAEVFDQDDRDGTVIVKRSDPSGEELDAARVAAEMCPNAVITVD
jgi:ferredoxin